MWTTCGAPVVLWSYSSVISQMVPKDQLQIPLLVYFNTNCVNDWNASASHRLVNLLVITLFQGLFAFFALSFYVKPQFIWLIFTKSRLVTKSLEPLSPWFLFRHPAKTLNPNWVKCLANWNPNPVSQPEKIRSFI